MQDLGLTPSTIILIALILAWTIWAVRRLYKKGMCDCSDHCDGCGSKKGCSGCKAANDMAKRLERL